MSEEAGLSRAEKSSGITAELLDMDKQEVAPAPESVAEVAPEESKPDQQQDVAPAPAVGEEESPKAHKLSDNDLVEDPADGEVKKWGDIKAERLRQSDYTRKTMALAEERRAFAEQKAQIEAQIEQARIAAEMAKLPELPDDDPYAQHIKRMNEQLAATAKYQMEMAQQFEQRVAARELEASRIALQAKEQELKTSFGLDDEELELVELKYINRVESGEKVEIDQIAKEWADRKAKLKESGVKEFKEKHRVSAPAASVSVPAAAQEEEKPLPGTRTLRERIREEFAALTS